MDLSDRSQPAHIRHSGRQEMVIPAGKTLKIETTPDGEEILNATVPEGKSWSTILIIEIVETLRE